MDGCSQVRRANSVFPPFADLEDDDLDGENGCHSILRKQQSLPAPRKKSVQFADGCGKPLVSVYREDEYNIHVALQMTKRELQRAKKTLHVCFPQPVATENFRHRLDFQSVCLENAVASQNSIWGTIKVKNISFHKVVTVRHTLDGWVSSTDVLAVYVPESNDGATDRFSFAITLPEYFLASGGVLEFAIRFESDGMEFWDNNSDHNYRIECREDRGSHSSGGFNRIADLWRKNCER